MKDEIKLPKESDSQEIGKLAEKAFKANIPDCWRDTALEGDSDFGLDYQIQVKNSEKSIVCNFFLQLKGTKSPKFDASKTTITHQFKVSTLNYYHKCEPLVMVVIVDLSSNEKPKNCNIYYRWLDDDFFNSISPKLETNDTVSVNIPLSNEFSDETDILPFYTERLAHRDALNRVQESIRKSSGDRDDLYVINKLADFIEEKPVLLDVTFEKSGAPWIDNPKEHNAGLLKHVSTLIKEHRINDATQSLNKIAYITLTDHEKAEWHSINGELSIYSGDVETSKQEYRKAYETFKSSRYKVKYYESLFQLDNLPSDGDLDDIINDLDEILIEEACVLAKCYALQDNFEKAINVLKVFDEYEVFATKLIVASMLQKTDYINDLCSDVDLDNLNDRSRFILFFARGRNKFYQGVKWEDTTNRIIPFTGCADYDFILLEEAYNNIESAWRYAKLLGYPKDLVLLLDISVLLFPLFNNQSTLMEYFVEIIEQQQTNKEIINYYILFLFNTKQYRTLIIELDKITDLSPEFICFYIYANYKEQDIGRVLELLETYKGTLVDKKPFNFEKIFGVGAHCARLSLDFEKEQECLDLMRCTDVGRFAYSLYELGGLDEAEGCGRLPKIEDIYKEFESNNKNLVSAESLVMALRSGDPQEADFICNVVNVILSYRELYPEENIHYAQALSTLKKWGTLETLANKVIGRGDASNIWRLIKSAALDEQGQSAEALVVLDSGLSSDDRNVEIASRYVNLCLRLGLKDRVEDRLLRLMVKCDNKQMIGYLEALLFVYSSDPKFYNKFINALSEYGKLIDQRSEQQEGQFLSFCLSGGAIANVDMRKHIPDLDDRFQKFFSKFPKSKILRTIEFPSDDPESFLSVLESEFAVDEEVAKKQKSYRYQLRCKSLSVPYLIVPGVLHEIRDVFDLWHRSKYMKDQYPEYCLVHSPKNNNFAHDDAFKEGSIVFIDETSLLLLHEVELLNHFFDSVYKVSMLRGTYDRFVRCSHSMDSSLLYEFPLEILHILQKNLSKIVFMGAINENLIQEYKETIEKNKINAFCCDDLYLTEYLKLIDKNIIYFNALNVVDYLCSQSIIDDSSKYLAMSKLCGCGLHSPSIPHEDAAAALKWCVDSLRGNEVITNSLFKHVFDSLFPLNHSFAESVILFVRIISGTIEKSIVASNGIKSDIIIVPERLESKIIDLPKDPLKDLVAYWMIRCSTDLSLFDLLTKWFICSCQIISKKVVSVHINRSLTHHFLWELYSELCREKVDNNLNDSELFDKIASELMILTIDKQKISIDVVLQAFIPETGDYDLLKEIFIKTVVVQTGREYESNT